MPSDLATRYKTVRNLVARSKALTIRDVATARTIPVLFNGDIAPFGTVGSLPNDLDGPRPNMPRGASRTAALDPDVKEAAFTFLRSSKFGTLSLSMGEAAKKEGLNLGLRDVARVLKAWFADKEPSDDKEEAGFKYLKSPVGQKLFMGLVEGVTKVLRKEGARTGFKDVGEAIVAFAEDK